MFNFNWYESLLILLIIIVANICAVPHLLMSKPNWSARLLEKAFGQTPFLFDLYKTNKKDR